jgi:hypothetical protein
MSGSSAYDPSVVTFSSTSSIWLIGPGRTTFAEDGEIISHTALVSSYNPTTGDYSLALVPANSDPLKMSDLTEACAGVIRKDPVALYEVHYRLASMQLNTVIKDYERVGADEHLSHLELTKTSTFSEWYSAHLQQYAKLVVAQRNIIPIGRSDAAFTAWKTISQLETVVELPAPAAPNTLAWPVN